MTVDLAQVGFLDSTALGVLIAETKRLGSVGGTLDIVCPHPYGR